MTTEKLPIGKPGILATSLFALLVAAQPATAGDYSIVDTGQDDCYDTLQVITPPAPGTPFYGQDAQHDGNQPSYTDNGDGTVTDNITGLSWVQARGSKTNWYAAVSGASQCRVGGHSDWRMPTIKELYSLIDFRGFSGVSAYDARPYLDTTFFEFRYGDTLAGERYIDCQDWTATLYVGTVMVGDSGIFGVNFADGRIKGYPTTRPQPPPSPNLLYVRYVRGNPAYGTNDFIDNGDGTVTDEATGLAWSQQDSDSGMKWEDALAWVQARNDENWLGHSDWRLPNAKELQSVVDYTRSPAARTPSQVGPAIDTSVFVISSITNERGEPDYPSCWTSTTHLDGPSDVRCTQAVYVTFGRAHGWMQLPGDAYYSFLDVHGAGAQRSDPKRGDVTSFYIGDDSLGNPVYGRGPQGDGVRIENHVRLVRDADVGVGESWGGARLSAPGMQPSVIHDALHLVPDFGTRSSDFVLLDASGRHVADLVPGWNDVRQLSPGVYFLRPEDGSGLAATRKVIIR